MKGILLRYSSCDKIGIGKNESRIKIFDTENLDFVIQGSMEYISVGYVRVL